MDSKEKTTPQKMQNILYEQVHGKRGSRHSDSPLRFLPNFSTPPTRFTKIFNPFEAHINERLHLPVFSPSVFKTTSSPKPDDKFKWTIDEIAMLKPADIDPNFLEQYEEHDSLTELKVQEKINTFFSEKIIVPSPLNQAVESQSLISGISSPENCGKTTCDVAVQTVLSLPLELPKEVEEALKPYFQTDCEHDSNRDLYKKLFEFEEQRTPGSAQTSPALSVALSPIEMSPCHHAEIRNSGIFCNEPPTCNLSPILDVLPRERRSATRLNFSRQMSLDSIACVPDDTDEQMPTNRSLTLDYTILGTPPRQELSTTSNNWDLEYNHVSLASDSDMDCSNANTPRSKIFSSQRKKLSDSFIRQDFEHDDARECLTWRGGERVAATLGEGDETDGGYQTGSILLSEESTWSGTASIPLFASTPTKNKKHQS